jgi:hypothetical protein
MDPNLTNTITDFVMYDSDLQAVDSCDRDTFEFDSYSFMGLLMLLVYGVTKYRYTTGTLCLSRPYPQPNAST